MGLTQPLEAPWGNRWRAGGCSEDRVRAGALLQAGRHRQKGDLGNPCSFPLRPVGDFLYHLKCIKSDSLGIVFVINIDKTGNFTHLISLKVFEDDVMTF